MRNVLKYRRQFLLSKNEVHIDDEWEKYSLKCGPQEWFINYHPDLNFIPSGNDIQRLILLGYILDPLHPEYTDKEILTSLVSLQNIDDIIKNTTHFCGRYILIYINKESAYILNDAVGFREAYYTVGMDQITCGSSPDIIAEHLHLQKTTNTEILTFFNSNEYQESNTWIGYKTLYDNIFHLPPNFLLDVNNGQIRRYWPTRRLEKTDLETCARQCAKLLTGTFDAAINRYNIHMAITAGWDTRLLLAASKMHKDRIFYFVNKPNSLSDSHRDIRIPKKISEFLDLKLNILEIDGKYDSEFERIFYLNNVLAHKKYLSVFYNAYRNKWDHTYTLTGTMANGLARIYIPFPKGYAENGKTLSKLVGYSQFKYVIDELDTWCNQVVPICRDLGINIMDLYQWEQENAHWASLVSSEQDIVREEIRPMNNRKLIELFWSLEDKYRYQYYPQIYIRIMKILWKDVLRFPLNPSKKSFFYKLLRILGIEQFIYYQYKGQKIK